MRDTSIEQLFLSILKPSLGCTDPAAVALGVAAATRAAQGWVPGVAPEGESEIPPGGVIDVRVVANRNLFKQAFSVPIPNSGGHTGLLMASALGVFCDPARSLELFSSLDPRRVQAAEELVSAGKVRVSVHPVEKAGLYVDASVVLSTPGGRVTGSAEIRHEHSCIVSVGRNGRRTYSRSVGASGDGAEGPDSAKLRDFTFPELVRIVENLPETVVALIRETVETNLRACEFGKAQPVGLGTGFHAGDGGEQLDAFHVAANMAAAASDARMSGHPVPVMSSAGSGNQGIIATIPVVAYSRRKGIDEGRMLRAVALSHLVTMYLTSHIGYLSALCGVAIKAGIGAACGITYADGGGADDVGRAVKVMAASLAGMICDGAKTSCSLKVALASDMAIRGAILAGKRVEVPDDSGIVGATAEETVRNLAVLGASMDVVDDRILEIMTAKLDSRPAPQSTGETQDRLESILHWNMY